MPDMTCTQVRQLLQELTHERPYIRRSAVGTLAGIIISDDELSPDVQPTVITSLLARLQDDDYSVCTASIRALRAMGVESGDAAQIRERTEALVGHMGAEFPNVRRFAIEALTHVIQPDDGPPHEARSMVVTALRECLQDEDYGVRAAATRALRTLDAEA